LFVIDTGSNSGLVLAPRFVRKNGFDGNLAGAIRIDSAAVDGLVDSVVMRLGRFDVGGAAILRPLTQLRLRDSEISGDSAVSGSIGSKILQQFVLTFDYARGRLWLERSPAFGAKTSGGTTGFQAVKLDSPDFRIVNVIPSTPAATAGLRVGDVITAIDGIPSAAVGLDELAELTGRPDGTVIHLRVQRDGAEEMLAITLKELVP
jgi:membrane-associated protease RseP (regulator of RpoE activity)